jgi:hypothetical protein
MMGSVRKSAGCNTEGCQGYQSTVTFATHREAAAAWNTRSAKPLRRRYIWTERRERLPGALDTLTDAWIEGGNYSEQTVTDLRDALRDAWQANAEIRHAGP